MSCRLALCFICILVLSGCDWGKSKKPSILLIAVDSLSFEKVNCDQSQDLKGFQVFCDEAIRFTHNFTPSTMSQASLASIFTARYPIEHGVWHNGPQFLSNKYQTVAETAVENGYRTSFYSGGPPIFKKSGLGQGFEKFEDYIHVKLNKYYRPVSKNFDRFLRWLDFEVSGDPFLSVVYVPDLQFRSEKTQSDAGLERAREYKGQLQELSESLETLISKMKAKGVWYNTHVFLVGLNGFSSVNRPGELAPANLYSEIVQTPLFIKPSQKIRDQGINWKIDRNVSLVDLGATLFDILGEQPEVPQNRDLEVTSLVSVMDKPDVAWNSQRYILIESAFPQWRKMGGTRFSIRSGHYSLIYDRRVKLFNTLIDRVELSPISYKDKLWKSIFRPIEKYMKDNGLNRWQGPSSEFITKIKLANLIWGKKIKDSRFVNREINRAIGKKRKNREIYGWKAEFALINKQWRSLLIAAKRARNKAWLFLASKKLGLPIKLPMRGCSQFFMKDIKDIGKLKNCNDSLFVSLMLWKMQGRGVKKERLFDKFLRDFYDFRLEKALYIENLKNGLTWDVGVKKPFGPSLTEVYLHLSKNKKLLARVEKRLAKF